MAGGNDEIEPEDLLLTAYLDGELAADDRAATEARLAAEPDLRQRLERLAGATAGLRPAYDALLAVAPVDRLQTIFDQAMARGAVTRPANGVRWGRYAAALAAAIAIFVVGGVAGRLLPGGEPPHDELNWRQVVAEYQSLTTTETLAAIPDAPDVLAPELKTLSSKLSVELTQDRLALPGATLKRADLFNFSGRPLVQLAYLTESDGPVALCIIPTPKPDAALQFETRNGFNVAFWNDDGRAYMVIGTAPRATLERFATVLAGKV
jgi:anti-sigma factor RsiW